MPAAAAARGAPRRAAGRRVDALVTDAQSRAGVAAIRALGRAGLTVCALASRRGAAGLWSRMADVRALGPASCEPGFIDRIGELARRHGPCVLMPSQEETLQPLADGLGRLPREAIVPYPGAGPLRTVRDKAALALVAAEVGLATPAVLAKGPAGELLADLPPAPVAVKTPVHADALQGTRLADTTDELRTLLAALPAATHVVVQEQVTGPLVGLSLVLDRAGEVVARFQQTAELLWPPRAGGSRRAVSTAPDADLVDGSAALLHRAGFWGLAQLQFIAGPRGPVLVDANPRFYGSLPLASASGVNLPAAWHAVAIGVPVPRQLDYRVGVSYRWLQGEIFAALRGEPRELFARVPRPHCGAMWATDDPLPSAIMAAEAAWKRVRSRLRTR